ncbi:MAG: tetratricopeptide repeat protein, partial [Thermoanaerobaculia bacterium]|nr:tetratricopeptide repeat protein [Thermoanaerobaculia bacterium]
MSTGMLVALAVAAVAVIAAVVLFRSLSALKTASAEQSAQLEEKAGQLEQEKERLAGQLAAAIEERDALAEKSAELGTRLAAVEAELDTTKAERDSLADKAKREQTTQRFFFGRKAREAFETFRQRLAADGFPERLEELAGDNPKTLTEEARKILKDVESWAEQGGVEDATILHTLALVDYSRGDVERARLRLRKAARTSSDALLFENLGDLYRISGKLRTALENYKIAAKTAPETSPVHRKLGLALYDAKDFGAAVKPLKTALELHREDPDLHLRTARALLESGDFQGTVEVAQAAGRKFPKDPLLPSCAILAYGRMKKFRDAQKTFEKAVEIDPKSADVHVAHGMALLDEGKLPEAAESFRTALECDASRPEAHYGLGLAANRDFAFDTALGHLKKSVGLKPDYAEAWYAMKTTYEGLKKFEA